MLQEFAITPQVFDPETLSEDTRLEIIILQFLKRICESGMIADLNEGQWMQTVYPLLKKLPQQMRYDIKKCFSRIKDRKRLIRYPRTDREIKDEKNWIDLSLETHKQSPFDAIIHSNRMLDAQRAFKGQDDILPINKLYSSNLWDSPPRDFSIRKNETDFRKVLNPILRHANHVRMIDPYLNPKERRFVSFVELCLKLLGQRSQPDSLARISIHASNRARKVEESESVESRLNAWEEFLKPFLEINRYHISIYLWGRNKDNQQRFHDRYILTDQCGVSVPGGLECEEVEDANETICSLLNEDVRSDQINRFDEATSPFRLLGKREIKG